MSRILASMLAAGLALGLNSAMAEDTHADGNANAWTDCNTLTGQDRALCQKSSEFSKKVEQARPEGSASGDAGQPTMTPIKQPDPTDELKAQGSLRQQGEASSSLPEAQNKN